MIYFRNNEPLPIAAVTTLGVSVKDGDSPIGQFGTGLKYTIAGVLRLGGRITIHTGGSLYRFGSEVENIRGKPFEIVKMKKDEEPAIPLGFTTDLGKHWEPWMYVRELWSNCMDESGDHGWGSAEGPTVVEVQCDPIEQAYANRDEFLLSSTPIITSEGVEFHDHHHDSKAIFYRGIKVMSTMERHLYTYNFQTRLRLTEDRTLSVPWAPASAFTDALVRLEDEEMIERIVTTRADSIEHAWLEMASHRLGGHNEKFEEVVHDLFVNNPTRLAKPVSNWAHERWQPGGPTREPTAVEAEKLRRARALLAHLDFDLDEVFVSATSDTALLGFVHEKKVYVTGKCLQEGVGTVACTLLEEYLHAKENLRDNTRAMQDRLLGIILKMYEDAKGEPI